MTAAIRSQETLLDLFTRYNHDLWPAHVLAYALGILVVVLIAVRPGRATNRIVAITMGCLWIWLGAVFQAMYATDIDATLGAIYAVLFLAQGILLLRAGIRGRLHFDPDWHSGTRKIGWSALAYALVVYPLIGATLGHGWPEAPLFGMAPCPTTIVTFGVLLLAEPPVPRHLLVIPFIWAILAPPAAVGRGVWEDTALLVFGVLALAVVLKQRQPPRATSPRSTASAASVGLERG
jgi:hypothetical protein